MRGNNRGNSEHHFHTCSGNDWEGIAQLIHLDLSLSVLLHHKRNVIGKM